MKVSRMFQQSTAHLIALLLLGGMLCGYRHGHAAMAQAPHWEPAAAPTGATLKQVVVGSANAIWALDVTGNHYKWNGAAWEKKGCCVGTLSVGADGTLWATHPSNNNKDMRWNGTRWDESVPAGMKQVSVVNASTVWGVDDSGTHWKLNGAQWEKKACCVSQIAASSDGELWAVNHANMNRVLRWTGTGWDENFPTGMVYLAVGSAQNIWGLDAGDQVFKLQGKTWQKMPGTLHNISVASDGTVWGVSAQGAVSRWVPGWEQMPGLPSVTFKQIAVTAANTVWALDTTGNHYKWNGKLWEKKGCCVGTLSAGADGTLWATHPSNNNKNMRWNGTKWDENVPSGMKQVAVVNASTVWGLDDSGTHWKLNGAQWEKKACCVGQIAASSDGELWATNPANLNRVLRWTGTTWDENFPAGIIFIAVGNAQNIWGLDAGDQIFKLSGKSWQQVPGALHNIAVASDGTVWGVSAQGVIFRSISG